MDGWLFAFRYTQVDDGDGVDAVIAAGATVVDTRSPGEYAAGHVPGAINVSTAEILADPDAFLARGDVPSDKPLLLHGSGGPDGGLHAAAAALDGRSNSPRVYLTTTLPQ